MNRSTFIFVGLAWTLFLGATGTAALAQDILIKENENENEDEIMNVFELNEANFEQWVFGNVMRGNSIRTQLESALMISLGEIDRSCQLTEAQKKKLILAGHGDIKHFLDKLAEARQVFDELKRDQNNIQAIFQETQPLAAMIRAGLFGTDSIFNKSVASTLDPEQEARYKKLMQEKLEFRHKASILLAVARLDQALGLTADQRKKLTDLMIAEIKPVNRAAGQYESNILTLRLGKIPEAKLTAFLDQPRYKALQRQIQQNRGLEQFFKANGFLEEDEKFEAAKPDAVAPARVIQRQVIIQQAAEAPK